MSIWTVARRPKWIGALLLALAIAAGFAALGQWQFSRAIEGGTVTEEQTETVVPLGDIATPQGPMPSDTIGQLVRFEAEWIASDYLTLSGRSNLAEPGYWVVGHAVVSDGASIAVAVGWASDADVADTAIRSLQETPSSPSISGRYLPSESPQESDFEAGIRSALAVSELVNIWGTVPNGVYHGYVVLDAPVAGLEQIDSPPPSTEVSVNLLNVFYAAEWVIFAGFAVFLWWRLVKDEWEEEVGSANVD